PSCSRVEPTRVWSRPNGCRSAPACRIAPGNELNAAAVSERQTPGYILRISSPARDGNMSLIAAHGRPRLWTLLFAVLAAFFLCSFVDGLAARAVAQEDGGDDNKGDDKTPDKGSSGDSSSGGKRNIFIHILKSVGWVFGITLLIVSIALVTLVVLLS